MINVLTHMSDIMIPMVIFWIVGYGMVSGVKVYETFLKGAKEGLRIVVEILPTLVGLMMAVGILRTSGFFELLGKLIGPATPAGPRAPRVDHHRDRDDKGGQPHNQHRQMAKQPQQCRLH